MPDDQLTGSLVEDHEGGPGLSGEDPGLLGRILQRVAGGGTLRQQHPRNELERGQLRQSAPELHAAGLDFFIEEDVLHDHTCVRREHHGDVL
jgi:hypothetical protein